MEKPPMLHINVDNVVTIMYVAKVVLVNLDQPLKLRHAA